MDISFGFQISLSAEQYAASSSIFNLRTLNAHWKDYDVFGLWCLAVLVMVWLWSLGVFYILLLLFHLTVFKNSKMIFAN